MTQELSVLLGKHGSGLEQELGARGFDALVDDIVESFSARVAHNGATAAPLRLLVKIDLSSRELRRGIEIGAERSHLTDECHSDAECYLSLGCSDLIELELGRCRLASLIATGRAEVSFDDDVGLGVLLNVGPAPGHDRPEPEEVLRLPLDVAGRSDIEATQHVTRLGLDAMLRSYARVQAEALGLSAPDADDRQFLWRVEVLDHGDVHAVEIACTPTGCVMRPVTNEPASFATRWMSSDAFALYLARRIDVRDAVTDGSCVIDGDRDLAVRLYLRISQQWM
ncbi:MAG: hypothetical protein ACT4OX_12995 [Actinomycetota bacterium]